LVLNVFWFLSLALVGRSWAQTDQIKVKQIEVSGNKRIETSAIMARIKTHPGDPFVPEDLARDLKSVYEMGYFEDVQIRTESLPDGMAVTFVVVERPFLVEIKYAGNKEILEDQLKDQVTLRKQTFVDDLKIKNDAERIRRYYEQEGYHGTEVIPVLKSKGPDRVGLIYYIREGKRAKVREIEFPGRQGVSKGDLLRAMETGKFSVLTTWMTNRGYYKEDALDIDRDRVREVYLNNGYLEAQVGKPEVNFTDSRSEKKIPFPVAHGDLDREYEFRDINTVITIPVVEGEQYSIREIHVSGNTVADDAKLLSLLAIRPGDLFRRNRMREGVSAIQDFYGEKGYLYASVVPQFAIHKEDRTVDLLLRISEDHQIRIREIHILGNDKTRDKVIRREVRQDEHEIINTKLLRRSFQRINNLNFFDSVEINPTRVAPDQVDLSIRVKEKSTGAMSIGGGYSSVDGAVGLLEITQGNLFGRGELLRGRGEFGRRRTTYSLTFREPYLFDKPYSGTWDVYNSLRDFNTYKERRIGGDFVLGKSFTEYLNGSLSYKWETLHLFDMNSPPPLLDENGVQLVDPDTGELLYGDDPVPTLIREQRGKSITSSVQTTLAWDSRDFYFDPKEGERISASVEYAGTFLGGDNDFVKTIFDISKYFPLFWDTVFSVHSRLGYAVGIRGDELPVGERFFVGGINTVRGFDFGEAGPCRKGDALVLCSEGDIVGGNKELIFNVEYLFPLVKEAKVKGVLFFDAGRGFDDSEEIRFKDLRTSAGGGLRWISPIGPLRFEWGYNLKQKPGEAPSKFEFSIGTLF
jgi:outer membrane protein insertion porin family